MRDTLKRIGYWWLPEAEEKKLPGILTFSQEEGATLEVVGVLGTGQPEPSLLILGMDQQGNPITLSKCTYQNRSLQIMGPVVGNEKYSVLMVFEGAHFLSEAHIKFHQLCGCYTDLDAWVDINGFKIEPDFTAGKGASKISYEKPQNQLFEIGDNIQIGIGFACNGPNWSRVQTEAQITQLTYMLVENMSGDIEFECLFEKLNTFSYLLQIATHRVAYPISIFGFSKVIERKGYDEEKYHPEIKIYYQPIEPIQKQNPIMPQEMLFTYKDLDVEQIKKWFSSFNKFETQFHLYRALLYNNRLFLETKFLNIAQALESLHGILYGSLHLSTDEFKRRKDVVLKLVPEELKGWVDGALHNANYKSFKLRIYELLNRKAHLLSACINDIEEFSKRVRDTRNEIVHQGKQKGSFRSRKELFSATRLLSILFEMYLLEIMGFPTEKLDKISKRQTDKYLRFGVKF